MVTGPDGHRRAKRKGIVTAVAGVALVASACGSTSKSASSPSSGSTATSAPSASALGTPKAATGTPLRVGYITDGQNGSIDNLSEIPAAQAAVKYVNGYLGGVAGHVLSLDVCDDGDTPAGATNCANQMIANKVPIVLNNVSGQDGTIYAGLSAAGVPMLTYGTSVAAQLTGKLSYILTNSIASSFAGPAVLAQQDGSKKAAAFVIDVPAASGPAKALDPLIYKAAGIPVDVVAIAPGTADMTPQVQAEVSKGVDFIAVLGDVSFCTSVLKAEKSVGFKGTTSLIQQCVASGSSAGIPGGYAGDKMVTSAATTTSDTDVQLYEAAMKQFAPGTAPFANGVTQGGFATVLGFARAMTGLTSAPTSANIESALSTMAPQRLPFGGGGTFQCNGKQVPIAPDICSSGALVATLDSAGNPVGSYTPLSTTALLAKL